MWQKNVRYLDYNATSGVSGHVRKKLIELLNRENLYFANPSSSHRLGQQSSQILIKASQIIAKSFSDQMDVNELVFTGSGTESNQTVIRSAMQTHSLIIIGSGEHSASYDLISNAPESVKTISLPMLSSGQYDFEFLKHILNQANQEGIKKAFLSLFWANNETGVINHLTELKKILISSEVKVSLHLDAAQVWGKIPLDLYASPADFVTFSAHKIGSIAGVGLIWIRPGAILNPLILGSQSRGYRGGTENLIGIAALSYAVEKLDPKQFIRQTQALQKQLEQGLKDLSPAIKIWSQDAERITNTTRMSFVGFKSNENWVQNLDLKGFAVSHGSACKSNNIVPSRVLIEMGAKTDEALNTIRVSFGPDHHEQDVSQFLIALGSILSEKSKQS